MNIIKLSKNTLLLLVLFLNSVLGYSQISPKEYNCYRSSSSLEIDGFVYDEVWRQTEWSDFFVDIEGNDTLIPDYSTRMKMLWDDNYLYIAAEIEDPHIWAKLKDHDNIVYFDNDFEIFIDPDGDGLNYFEIEINALQTILDLFLNKPYNKKGKADLFWNADGMKKGVKIYGEINDPNSEDLKWTVEFAIPWNCYHSRVNKDLKPSIGDVWRMNFSRVQWETEIVEGNYVKRLDPETCKSLPENNWVWSPQGKINMHIPEYWGYVTFQDEIEFDKSLWTEDGYPKFWIWMGGGNDNTAADWESIFRKLDDTGIKGFLFGADTALLAKVIPIADQYDIHVHAWFWTMNRSDALPEWLSVNQLGQSLADEKAYVGYYKFMCPAIPEVGEFIKQKMNSLAQVEGLKGIHMDYIRYVDVILPVGLQPKYGLVQDHIMPEFDYGYHPYMRSLYKKAYGVDPMELNDPGNDEQWLKFRLDELNKTVIGLRDHVKKKNINITAAVFPTPQMSSEMVRQDWGSWKLDWYFPMVYHNFYNEPISWITEVVAEDKAAVGKDSKVFCGLYLPGLKNGNDVTKAIKAAMAGGADGVAFFSYGGLNGNAKDQIKNYIQNNHTNYPPY